MSLPAQGDPNRSDVIGRTVAACVMILVAGVLLATDKGSPEANYMLISGALAVLGVQLRRDGPR